jgi:hypothetical protein
LTALTDLLDSELFFDCEHSPGDLPDGDAFLAWRLRSFTPAEFRGLSVDWLSRKQLAYLAWCGLLAPTSHNTVPQWFELLPEINALRVWLDRSRVLPASDPSGRQATLSIGCAIGNIALAALCVGLDVDVKLADTSLSQTGPWSNSERRHVPLMMLRFRKAAPPANSIDWIGLMRRRKMVRAEYDGSIQLSNALVEQLQKVVAERKGVELYLITDPSALIALGKLQELADNTVINRVGFARELGDWLLENNDLSTIGMRGREFGLSDEAAQRFHRGFKGQISLFPDETAALAKIGNIGIRTSSAVGVITVAQDDLEHRLAAGWAFEEVCLRLLCEEFVVSVHAGTIEVEASNLALKGRLQTRNRPVMFFRIGKPRRPEDGQRPHSSRPRLSAQTMFGLQSDAYSRPDSDLAKRSSE